MEELLETGSNALLVLLILIAAYVLYQRLLRALGKGKYKYAYPEIESHKIDRVGKTISIAFNLHIAAHVKIEVFDHEKKSVLILCDENFAAGKQNVFGSISSLAVGKYTTRFEADGHVMTKFFSVKG